MMIRINLLPVRAVKKREMGRQLVALFALALVVTGVGNYLWYGNREAERQRNATRLTQTQARIAELEKVIGEVNNINARKTEVERKLTVLGDLRKSRSGPVRMMDALSAATPKHVWLRTFRETNNAISIAGTARSHDEVAEFMRGLGMVVWTPKGMARLVEQRREAKTSRVEMLNGEATIEELPVADIQPFFTNIDLRSAVQKVEGSAANPGSVDFDLTLATNYAI